MNQTTLHDVNLSLLKPLLRVSSTLHKGNDTISMQLSTSVLTSSNKNLSMSVIKRWQIETAKLCSKIDNPSNLKISIFGGQDFVKKVLSYFGDVCTIEILHDGVDAKQLTIKKLNDKGKLLLKIDVICANNNIAYFAFTPEQIQIAFGLDASNNPVHSTALTLSKDDINNIRKLLSMKLYAENQKPYITIYAKDDSLYATDQIFDVILDTSTYNEGFTSVDLDKISFMQVEPASYDCSVFTVNQHRLCVMTAKIDDVLLQTSMNLLTAVQTDVNIDDFEDFSNGFDD